MTIPTLCPACGVRPRRSPGQRCLACDLERQRTYRRSGKRSTRVPAETSKRFWRQLGGGRYIITSAQNATPVHAEFFKALQVYAKHHGAELVVIPLRYKNPTSIWSSRQQSDEWWAPEAQPYLFSERKKLCANLVLVGDVKIQPTAVHPLSGFQALTGGESCIIGHPKMQFVAVPAPSGRLPKILSTTGACTKRNYTDTKAGALGAFHHFLGAVVVDVTGKTFHLRQVNADRITGEFTDLDLHYSPAGVTKAPPAAALVMGDIHARFICEKVDAATFAGDGIVETLNPDVLVWNDLFDGYSVNHHHAGNPFIAEAKARAGLSNVRAEVEHAVRFVAERSKGRRSVIVPSNHDNFLARWVVASDWKHAGGNKAFYLETATAMLRSARSTPGGADYADPFRYWVNRLKGDAAIRALELDESLKIAGVECGMHGDKGPNGARGTIRGFARVGARTVVGHSHTPGIEEGCYQTGTSTPLRLEYSRGGPSSWLNTHVVIYASGKRSLITVVDGAWRLPSPTPKPPARTKP